MRHVQMISNSPYLTVCHLIHVRMRIFLREYGHVFAIFNLNVMTFSVAMIWFKKYYYS